MAWPVHSPRYVSACIISNFLRFSPGVQILTWSLFFPSYLIMYVSLLHPEWHRNFPASFQLVLVRIVLHRVVCGYLTLPSWSSLPGIFHLFVPNQIYPFLQVWSYADYFFFLPNTNYCYLVKWLFTLFILFYFIILYLFYYFYFILHYFISIIYLFYFILLFIKLTYSVFTDTVDQQSRQTHA